MDGPSACDLKRGADFFLLPVAAQRFLLVQAAMLDVHHCPVLSCNMLQCLKAPSFAKFLLQAVCLSILSVNFSRYEKSPSFTSLSFMSQKVPNKHFCRSLEWRVKIWKWVDYETKPKPNSCERQWGVEWKHLSHRRKPSLLFFVLLVMQKQPSSSARTVSAAAPTVTSLYSSSVFLSSLSSSVIFKGSL